MYTEYVNKIALSSNDDKRFDRVTTYPYRANAFKVCERMLMVKDLFFEKLQ